MSSVKPGIDPEVLRAVVGDDPQMVREVVEDFVPAAHSGAAAIKAAVGSADPLQVKLASHKLKGSSLLVGARRLGDFCARLEQAGQNGDWQTIRQLMTQLDGLLSDVETSAAAFLGEERA